MLSELMDNILREQSLEMALDEVLLSDDDHNDDVLIDFFRPSATHFIWPDKKAPGDISTAQECIEQRAGRGELSRRACFGTQEPKLEIYEPRKIHKDKRTLIMIVPGGAYEYTSCDNEGSAAASLLSILGFTCAVLHYRLPCDGHSEGPDAPLCDCIRAMRVLKHLYGKKIQKFGVMGFSAGGHAAASLSLKFDENLYEPLDLKDDLSAKPDFCALLYPVISMEDGVTHLDTRRNLLGVSPTPDQILKYSLDKQVRPDAPPTFIVHAQDDEAVPAQNSILLCRALRRCNVKTHLQIFDEGGHGFGVRAGSGKLAGIWPLLFEAFVSDLN